MIRHTPNTDNTVNSDALSDHDVTIKGFTLQDKQYMSRAIELAKKGHFTTSPNPRVGCVLVHYQNGIGTIIGEGYHQKAGQGHAEVNALDDAKINNAHLIKGATAYVTLEPCSHFGRTPPCAKALVEAQVSHVIAAMVDPNPQVSGNGLAIIEKAGIKVQSGLLEKEAKALNVGFIYKMIHNLPYVRCKLAASLDGKTAMASGESKWITSSDARQDVQRLRAQSCAIITGADSVLFDNAKMNVRWSELGDIKTIYPEKIIRQPLRVIIDSQNRLTPNLAIFEHQSKVLIVTGDKVENSQQWPDFVEHVVIPLNENTQGELKINLNALLKYLASEGHNDVFIESGAQLSGAFIEQDLVNELILYQAPKLMGGDGKNLVEMPNITELKQAKSLSIIDVTMIGCDIRLTCQLLNK